MGGGQGGGGERRGWGMSTKAILPEAFEPLRTSIEQIRPDPANPKLHDSAQIDAIAASFLEFGQDQPIVADKNGVIAKGEGRYLAALQLGWEDVAVVFVDDDDLKRIRRNIADNRTHDMTGYDNEALLGLLQQVTDDEHGHVPGFTDADLEALMSELGMEALEFKEYDESIADDVEFIECPSCGHRFPK